MLTADVRRGVRDMQVNTTRPPKLYRYSKASHLDRSLRQGEFLVRPASDFKAMEGDKARQDEELVRVHSSPASHVTISIESSGVQMTPLGDVDYRSEVGTNYLAACFSEVWDLRLFEDFGDSDACLVIHQVEEFCERLHDALAKERPGWVGMDAAVLYGGAHPLGAAFAKPLRFIPQHEWRFVWLPPSPTWEMEQLKVYVGSLEGIAEVVGKPIRA